jgi:hypothetical protein
MDRVSTRARSRVAACQAVCLARLVRDGGNVSTERLIVSESLSDYHHRKHRRF